MLIITVTTTSNLPTTNMDKKIDNFFFQICHRVQYLQTKICEKGSFELITRKFVLWLLALSLNSDCSTIGLNFNPFVDEIYTVSLFRNKVYTRWNFLEKLFKICNIFGTIKPFFPHFLLSESLDCWKS